MTSTGTGFTHKYQPGVSSGPETSTFTLQKADLNEINESKDVSIIEQYGGINKIAENLRTDLHKGIDTTAEGDASIKGRQAIFGKNALAEVMPKSFISLVLEQISDPIIILLICAATISTILGVSIPEEREENAWIEGVAIWVAVCVVALVGATNDYQKDQQFRKLNAEKETFDVTVIRDNKEQLVKNIDLVVGDILVLNTGDRITADGLLFHNNDLTVDEASLTGESDTIKKKINIDPFCRSGTQVSDGSGTILVVAVGENSEWGKTLSLVTGDSDETPLQEKLAELAAGVGKIGFFVACLSFIVLIIRWMIEVGGWDWKLINENGPVQFFLFAVTIVVVAVPEGLPLAVTISLAYSMKKMMKDNNFVRVLAACETMGGATAICSDKTGTLTENRMTVVEGWFNGVKYPSVPTQSQIKEEIREQLVLNIALNSKAFLIMDDPRNIQFVGNRTECALLILARKWEEDYRTIRESWEKSIVKFYGFNSEKKMASVIVRNGEKLRLYNKGASEMVLEICQSYFEADGSIREMTETKKKEILHTLEEMASRGLRTLALAYRDLDPEEFVFDSNGNASDDAINGKRGFKESPDEALLLMAIVGIKDPVREQVPEAVRQCHTAGINVRMVTGDNILTAKHIARECGILQENGLAMEGPEFRKLAANKEEELLKILPKIQVLARSTPIDKYTLVSLLRRQGEVVAVTGDGTNDAPALKESDVGLAMGITGTEVAKEAADIVIMDDNFSSIVKAVLWGRAVFNNIRKFLQFQLTVNVVALLTAFIAAVAGGETPLNVLQLLWVNLIMDTLAALALATENPTPSLLLHKPHGREEALISPTMWKHILLISIYELFAIFAILYGGPQWFARYEEPNEYQAYCHWCEPRINVKFEDGMPVQSACCQYFSAKSYGGCDNLNCTTVTSNSTVVEYFEQYMHQEQIVEHAVEDAIFRKNSLIFNCFIFMQIFNEINARKIMDEYNILENVFNSPIFIGIFILISGMQLLIMLTPLRIFFKTTELNATEWWVSLVIGFGVIPYSMLVRFISNMMKDKAKKKLEQAGGSSIA